MFFVLSKLFYFLIQPLVIVLVIYGLSLFWHSKKRYLQASALILLLFYSNEFIANEALKALEAEPIPVDSVGTYPVAVVLTGMTSYKNIPRDRVHFNQSADRITDAIQLYDMGKVKQILISGGGTFLYEDYSEAEEIAKFLGYCGVPDSVVIIEDKARNTFENAKYSTELLSQLDFNGPILVITSAFHMRRTKGCFSKFNVEADFYPSDIQTYPTKLAPDLFYPSSEALRKWDIINKELAGIAVYKVMGYI